jgi:hypothetical protein
MTEKTKAWRVLIALVAAAGPLLQYGLMAYDETVATLPAKTVEFFSYFTILSNTLAAIALAAPLVAPASRLAAWSERAGPRVAIATYLAITAVVYHTMLAHTWDPRGLRLAATTLNHTITPAAFLIDLALRGGQGEARWIAALKSMAFPALFGAWTLAHGALSGFYPYPFMDVAKRGYPAVLVTIIQMGVAFALVCLIFVALLRVRTKLAPAKPAPLSA